MTFGHIALLCFVCFAGLIFAENCSYVEEFLHLMDTNGDGVIANTEIYSVARFCGDTLDARCPIDDLIAETCLSPSIEKRDDTTQSCIVCQLGQTTNCGAGDDTVESEDCVCEAITACWEEGLCADQCCDGCGCFPSDAVVDVENVGLVRMSELKVGDRVLSRAENGMRIYEDIYMFGHQDPLAQAVFVQIQLNARNLTLELTSDHFMPTLGQSGKEAYLRAGKLQVGMKVLLSDGTVSEITRINRIHKSGLFNPYTLSGRIVVNSIVASSHSGFLLDSVFDWMGLDAYLPITYQTLFAPARLAYFLLGKTKADIIGRFLVNKANAMILQGSGKASQVSGYVSSNWTISSYFAEKPKFLLSG
ncbi:hypothetical protein HDU82_003394 [Entophlyctis luteolus]|nr:hypothetical protein HDU82_003394 [Entophlyctis luteolus]